MSEVRKFMFDNQFDAPPPPPPPEPEPALVDEPPPPPPPPTFSEEELAKARDTAYQDGLAEGMRQGRSEALQGQGHLLNQMMGRMEGQLSELIKNQLASFAEAQDRTVQVALTIARKVVPSYAKHHGLGEVEALVRQCLAELSREPRLVVRTHDSLLDAVTTKVQALAALEGYQGQLVFLADERMGPGDCRVEWADGGLERDEARLWSEIDRVVGQAVQSNEGRAS